eukprot:TRINITY_DN2194_c0_g2_i1.p1 TRINITY_DN2194_c0_g2~~TRINITY_DN2194_c0_g2_i1.p1  ORF type:complete len:200 (+),score=34.50 TRINITY_DN2194_c0_g2_i1:1437-2036(+)
MKKPLIMGILALFGISCSQKKSSDENSMLLWEDDYLMVEIMSSKNLEYALKETGRISEFAEKHSDGNGFSEITAIKQKPIETKQLEINEKEFVELLNSVGIEKYPKLTYAGIGEPQIIENSKTKAFGSYSSAIFYDVENNKIEHIWFSTYDWKNIQKTKIADGLNAIGEKYDMIMVDFASEEVIDLKKKPEIEKYLKTE